jgi:hypothetical protein
MFMKYIIVCLLSLSFLATAGATGSKSIGGPPDKCGWHSQNQNYRPREERLRTFQDNRRNYKWYDHARESRTIAKDYNYNGGFRPNEY